MLVLVDDTVKGSKIIDIVILSVVFEVFIMDSLGSVTKSYSPPNYVVEHNAGVVVLIA
jgi:hypothetical protein